MRWAATILAATLVWVFPASGDAARLQWPLRPPPAVIRAFDAPSPNWNRGHRGVDLAGSPGQPVYAAGAATVVYAGTLAGRELVAHQLRAGPDRGTGRAIGDPRDRDR